MKNYLFKILVLVLFVSSNARADEGMWTFDNLPVQKIKERYGFEPGKDWIEKAYKATIRFNSGGTGAFVSKNGLAITNHHVAMSDLGKLSTKDKDYVKDGYFAKSLKKELKCPDLELNILDSIEDVSSRVFDAAKSAKSLKDKNKLKKAAMADIEKKSLESTGLRSNVIELYNGGQYHLYRYKKYTDIRLVMAPDMKSAQFGGEYDNYTYPRYQFDFAFFRVYENGKPLKTEHYFKWSDKGADQNELVFVTGNPGSTDRLKTVAQLKYDRDQYIPSLLDTLYYFEKVFKAYAKGGDEQERQTTKKLYSLSNYIKRYEGMLDALLDDVMFAKRVNIEKNDLKKIKENESIRSLASAWKNIEKVQKKLSKEHGDLVFHGVYSRTNIYDQSSLFKLANTIVRYVREIEKPNNERYKEFRDSNLNSLYLSLYSPAPIYKEMERSAFVGIFKYLKLKLGEKDKLVTDLLKNQNVDTFAKELVEKSKLYSPEYRKNLVNNGIKAVIESDDPIIQLAVRLDPYYKKTRKRYEDEIESVLTQEAAKIAKTRFTLYGKDVYPDANFTPRLSYGVPLGYEFNTTLVPYHTTFYGLFARNAEFNNKPPFAISEKIMKRKNAIDMTAPVNVVLTTDTVGGNSGSPVFTKNLEYVGIVFDRNIHGLSRAYLYHEDKGRSIAVDSAGITQALKNVYGMKNIVRELKGK